MSSPSNRIRREDEGLRTHDVSEATWPVKRAARDRRDSQIEKRENLRKDRRGLTGDGRVLAVVLETGLDLAGEKGKRRLGVTAAAASSSSATTPVVVVVVAAVVASAVVPSVGGRVALTAGRSGLRSGGCGSCGGRSRGSCREMGDGESVACAWGSSGQDAPSPLPAPPLFWLPP